MRFIITAVFVLLPALARAQVSVSTPALTVEQAYRPVSLRDPLIPATVYVDQKGPGTAASGSSAAGPAGSPAGSPAGAGAFTVSGLTLTGILEDSSGRQALLRDAAGGLYMLKAGRLIDSKKKVVPGVSGVIKGKQVILMTEDKKVHQLNLREKE